MSSTITPFSRNFFSWGYDKISQGVDYAVRTAKAVVHVAQIAMYNYRAGQSVRSASTIAVNLCPEFKRSRTLENQVEEAAQGHSQPVTTETYFDMTNLSSASPLPKTKRIHNVDDPKLIEELLHAKRNDFLLESGHSEDLDPLVQSDTMLLCPYAQHRTLRTPLEKTFTKREAQSKETLHTMAQTATNVLIGQMGCRGEFVIDSFVYATIVNQVLQLDISENKEKALVGALKDAQNPNTHQAARKQLDTLIGEILKEHHYKAGGGMDAIAEARLLSESQKISTAILMFAAGMHTTLNFLKFFTDQLTISGYNEKIHDEWNEFLQGKVIDSSEALTEAATQFVQRSDLLNSCYLEAMRLYPVFPIIKRVAKKNFMLGATRVYAGDEVHLNVMAAQRDSRHWDEPALFKPERFAGSLESGNKPALLNFGLGSQSCIGKHFVESEAKTMGALFCILLKYNYKNLPNRDTNNYSYNNFNISPKAREKITSEDYSLRAEWKRYDDWGNHFTT